MKMHKLVLLALACTWAMGASAQWQWIDKDGRKVFSDRPPPADISDKNILRQPGGGSPSRASSSAAPAVPAATDGATAAAPGAAQQGAAPAAGAGKDKELEEKKAQADAAEAAKKKAAEEKLAKDKADNCQRARDAKVALDSGRPMVQTNAKGERIFMDAAARSAESKRVEGVVTTDCAR